MKIYITYNDEQDSVSGFDISGVFANWNDALNWVKSEGNGQKILETTTGPIEWQKMKQGGGLWA